MPFGPNAISRTSTRILGLVALHSLSELILHLMHYSSRVCVCSILPDSFALSFVIRDGRTVTTLLYS